MRPASPASRRAGAIVIGKTNLDQFATGLVGVRSPYGVPRNPFNPALIPGGSSSGSAVAVGAGLVPLALGTDTAGSGRVPAGLNNIVGLKPSLGLVSTAGRRAGVPLARLRVGVRAHRRRRLRRARGDGRSRCARSLSRARVPLGALGSAAAGAAARRAAAGPIGCSSATGVGRAAYDAALARFAAARRRDRRDRPRAVPRDRAAALRRARGWPSATSPRGALIASRAGIDASGDAADHLAGARPIAVDAFAAFYRLAELRARARPRASAGSTRWWCRPCRPPTRSAEVEADPIGLNSRLGTYTNFVNLLDLAGLAVPAAMRADGTPFGVTLLAPGRPGRAARLHRPRLPCRHRPAARRDSACRSRRSRRLSRCRAARRDRDRRRRRASLRHAAQRRAAPLGARFLRAAATAPDYRLFALAGTTPPKPGLLRVAAGARRRRSRSRSGRCRRKRSAASSPPSAAARRSARCALADGRTREGLSGRGRGHRRARATFPPSAAGARSWRRRRRGRNPCTRCGAVPAPNPWGSAAISFRNHPSLPAWPAKHVHVKIV